MSNHMIDWDRMRACLQKQQPTDTAMMDVSNALAMIADRDTLRARCEAAEADCTEEARKVVKMTMLHAEERARANDAEARASALEAALQKSNKVLHECRDWSYKMPGSLQRRINDSLSTTGSVMSAPKFVNVPPVFCQNPARCVDSCQCPDNLQCAIGCNCCCHGEYQ